MTFHTRKAQITAGSMLTCRMPCHVRKVSRPAAVTGPSTSPMLPPEPCSDIANARLSGKRRERAPMAGG